MEYMENLWEETIKELKDHKKSYNMVVAIGSRDGYIDKEEFKVLAKNTTYDTVTGDHFKEKIKYREGYSMEKKVEIPSRYPVLEIASYLKYLGATTNLNIKEEGFRILSQELGLLAW